jgi:subtilisin-like proprotein convertase family protein
MRRHLKLRNLFTVLACALAAGLLALALFVGASAQRGKQPPPEQVGEGARRQIEELLEEKRARTPAQQKLNSQLVYAAKEARQQAVTESVPALRTDVKTDAFDRALVDVRGALTDGLRARIAEFGGEVVYHSPRHADFRARLPLDSLEEIAAWPEVKFVRPAAQARTNAAIQRERRGERGPEPNRAARPPQPDKQPGSRAAFMARVAEVKSLLERALPRNQGATEGAFDLNAVNPFAVVSAGPPFFTEGDITHRAREARPFFGADGAGVKVGVLSDSVRFLADSVALGSLPNNVTVLPGESGTDLGFVDIGEGTAMLEIIHALAPGAQLYFATAFRSPESFADNIRALREAGCDIIVDDVRYSNEAPFQDGVIARAVNDVTRDGALYFSSAGNYGNFNDGTATVWEGDYADGGALAALPLWRVHDFGSGAISNRVRQNAAVLSLFWSDALGESANDYDLFVLNANFTQVVAASTDFQLGDSDPAEVIFANFSRPAAFTNERVVIANFNGAEPRALRLDTFGSANLGLSTPGEITGHAAAADAFAVAAVDVANVESPFGFGSPFFTGGPTNPIEFFSSDGPRRVFYAEDGAPLTTDNFLFSTNGGAVRQKPDIAAADGVFTSTPGFIPFFGTSAAAPHAAAIAALLKSAVPNVAPQQVRQALQSSALDIRADGVDRDSGSGIVMAFNALETVGAQVSPSALLKLSFVEITGHDGTPFVDPGGGGRLNVQLVNAGARAVTGATATLTASTPGVAVTRASSAYPTINAPGNATNAAPFEFALSSGVPCGEVINFTLTVNWNEVVSGASVARQASFDFTGRSGRPGRAAVITYAGGPVSIPDADAGGVNIPLNVSGVGGRLWDINFRINGTTCSTAAGAATVGLDHTFVGDLTLTLIAPDGTRVKLLSRPGGVNNGGNNFCQVLLDDEALAPWVQNIFPAGQPPLGPPYTGTLKPALPLAALRGRSADGRWVLNVSDSVGGDVGRVRSFSLILTTAACGAVD